MLNYLMLLTFIVFCAIIFLRDERGEEMAVIDLDKKNEMDDDIINTVANIVFDNYAVSMDVTESKCVGEVDTIHISIYLNKVVE